MAVVGWCDGAGGASYNLDCSRARAYCTCSRCGWGCLDIFTLIYPFSPLFPTLWETARCTLKYWLKWPLNPKQPTNQSCENTAFLWQFMCVNGTVIPYELDFKICKVGTYQQILNLMIIVPVFNVIQTRFTVFITLEKTWSDLWPWGSSYKCVSLNLLGTSLRGSDE